MNYFYIIHSGHHNNIQYNFFIVNQNTPFGDVEFKIPVIVLNYSQSIVKTRIEYWNLPKQYVLDPKFNF